MLIPLDYSATPVNIYSHSVSRSVVIDVTLMNFVSCNLVTEQKKSNIMITITDWYVNCKYVLHKHSDKCCMPIQTYNTSFWHIIKWFHVADFVPHFRVITTPCSNNIIFSTGSGGVSYRYMKVTGSCEIRSAPTNVTEAQYILVPVSMVQWLSHGRYCVRIWVPAPT